MFGLFKSKTQGNKDSYLEGVASLLHSTMGPRMPSENAYALASECLSDLKSKMAAGVFHQGSNPRRSVMAYYCLCSMVYEAAPTDDRASVLAISTMARTLRAKLGDTSDFTPVEKGICLFCEKALSDGQPKHTESDIAETTTAAAQILVDLAREQGASVSMEDMTRLVANVLANVGNRDLQKAGEKVLVLSALSNVTAYSIDQGEIDMANVYAQAFFAAMNKFVKGHMDEFDDYQRGALKTIVREHEPVVKELMAANSNRS